MDDPLDAAPLDDAPSTDNYHAHPAGDRHTNESLRYRSLVRLLMAHDPSFKPPDADPVSNLAEHIAEVEARCAEVLKHLHPDEAERFQPIFPLDLRPH